MNLPTETNLEKLWESIGWNLEKQIPALHYEYKHLGYDYSEIFTTQKNSLEVLVQNTFYQFMIARFGHLFPYFDEGLIGKSDRLIKQEYNRLFVSLEYGKKQKMNTVLVVVAVIVKKIIQKVFPDVIYNQRLTIQIMHCLIICTLGIMVGDNSIKYMIGKELGSRQITRFLIRQMFQKKILIAKIKQIQEQKQWPQLKRLFYNPPPPPPEKVPFDEGGKSKKLTNSTHNLNINNTNDSSTNDANHHKFIRSLDSYHLKSIQMSRSFLNNNQNFNLKQSTLKKYPCKMNISLQCNSCFYKTTKNKKQQIPIKVQNQQIKQVLSNKKNLKYWETYLNNFKYKSNKISHQKFPPIIFNQEHKQENHTIELPPLNIKEKDQDKILLQRANNRNESRHKDSRGNHSSLHVKKDEPKVSVTPKSIRNTKHRIPGRTMLLKNQSKIFHQNRLQLGDEYGQSLISEFNKLNLIR